MNEIVKTWENFAKDSIVSMSEFFTEEGHKDHEYNFAERSIMISIHYLKSKRKGKECDEKDLDI